MHTMTATILALCASTCMVLSAARAGEQCCALPPAKPAGQSESVAAPIPYPLDTCIVSGSKLGAMGEPVILIHQGREIKFCCSGCLPAFKADPDTYLRKLR